MLPGSVVHLVLCCFLLTHHSAQGQANKVSSKLDFDDTDGGNSTSPTGVPVIIGQGQGQGQEQGQGHDQGNGRSNSGGNRPKIHGVRVTVDTGDGQQQTKESKESVEITDLGKHKKRVGIHTDITFEITAEGDANETSSAQQHGDKEDASVPIYKGRASTSEAKHKSRAPADPKSQWNPNFPSEHRGGSRSGPGDYYPQYYPQHVYTSGIGAGADAGSIYRSGETWTHYVPVWTTERPPREQGQLQRRPSWKPCYCISTYDNDYRSRRQSKAFRRNSAPTRKGVVKASGVAHVDGKLERPFS